MAVLVAKGVLKAIQTNGAHSDFYGPLGCTVVLREWCFPTAEASEVCRGYTVQFSQGWEEAPVAMSGEARETNGIPNGLSVPDQVCGGCGLIGTSRRF